MHWFPIYLEAHIQAYCNSLSENVLVLYPNLNMLSVVPTTINTVAYGNISSAKFVCTLDNMAMAV